MEISLIQDRLRLESELVAIAIVALALVVILLVNRKRLAATFGEWRIQRSLKHIGCEQIRDLICDDGLDGHFRIDRLALTRNAILLVSYKPYGGNIYCAERISEWTQVIGQKSFKFENPLFELENQITALKLISNNAPLQGYLFFNHSARFPKGHPESVLNPETLPDRFLPANCEPVSPEIRLAWEALKQHHKEAAGNGRLGVKT